MCYESTCSYTGSNIDSPATTFDAALSKKTESICVSIDKGESQMSLCFALILNSKTYLVTDSRSCVPNLNFEENNFTHRKLGYTILSNECKKIFRLPINNRTIVGFSTGRNTFVNGTLDLQSFIKKIAFSERLTLLQCATTLGNAAALHSSEVFFDLFEYVNKELWWASISVKSTEVKIQAVKHQPSTNDAFRIVSGADWAKNILDCVRYQIPETEQDHESLNVKAFNDIFKRINVVGEYFDNTVGGDIRIAKLSADGFEWIQNGYEL